jgi:tetratricopeptide (TPR) repeat protein
MNYLDARKRRPTARLAAPLVTFCLGVTSTALVSAVEPAEQFLKGLQERGLNELAVEYLDGLRNSRAINEEFRKQIPYHRGVALVEQSRLATDPALRARLLDEARSELENFTQANPESVLSAEAQLQLASVQMAEGQQLISQLSQLPSEAAYDAQRKTLEGDARTLFATARETFNEAAATYSAELEKLPPTDADPKGDAANRRQEYRGRVAQLRYLAAQTQFEAARTHPPEADEFRELNKTAADELSAIYEEFGRSNNSFVGLYARLAEGRCYQALGDYAIALGCYEDILAQPNVLTPFRKLIASALQRKSEILTIQKKYDAAIELADACLRDATAEEHKEPEWIAVQFRLAEALQKKSQDVGPNTLDGRKLVAEARGAYRLVANTPGEYQTAARLAISTVAREKEGDEPQEAKEEPKTFQEAYDLGKDAVASYNAAKLAVPSAERNNPEAVPELHSQMEQGKNDARRYFRAASTLVEDDTDQQLLNEVRYFLCWLYWESEDYYRAAVLGEFLARRYPDHPAAASAAKFAMGSYERLYTQALAAGIDANTDFESRRMADMAEFISRRWPGTDDADAAQSVLVSYAIRNDRIEDAERMLAEASQESRPRLELQLGNAMWGRYIELSQPGAKLADAATLPKLKESAIKYLRNGFEAAKNEQTFSESAAAAGLYLVQALLSDEKYDDAIELLEDSKFGPLELIAQRHEASSRPQFVVETYKAALRAYVLSSPPQERKALAIMKSLDKAIAEGGGNEEQLTQIYIGLGVALEKQAEQLRAAGREKDAARITAAFSQFLNRIAERQETANWPTRAWLAQTYYNMGMAGRAGAPSAALKPLTETQKQNLTAARTGYEKLLADAAKDPKLPPTETSVLAVQMQLGECLRALGQYAPALDTFSAILKDKEASIVVQKAAAQTYQERGQRENAKWFENAIHGGHKLKSTGQNRIWGWLKISQVAQRAAQQNPQYHDTFYEARANIARCRYLAAMKQKGDERKQNLNKAKQGIQSLAQVYPDMGGEKWRVEFDTLMKQIQTAAGEKAVGLGAIQAPKQPAADRRGG